MKIKTNLKSIWITTMLSLIAFLFVVTCMFSQPYISFSVDANKLLHLKDNERTVNDWYGLDYDLEVGAIDNNIGVYLYYGEFKSAYSNYGFGVDYYISILQRFKISIGNYYSKTMRHSEYHYLGGSVSYYNPRGKITYYYNNIGIGLVAKHQYRGDINKRIFEGQIELIYKFR